MLVLELLAAYVAGALTWNYVKPLFSKAEAAVKTEVTKVEDEVKKL